MLKIKNYLYSVEGKAVDERVDVVFPHISCSTYWESAGSPRLRFFFCLGSRSVNHVGGYLSWQRRDVIRLLPKSTFLPPVCSLGLANRCYRVVLETDLCVTWQLI